MKFKTTEHIILATVSPVTNDSVDTVLLGITP